MRTRTRSPFLVAAVGAVVALTAGSFLAVAQPATASGHIVFDGSPGTGPPPTMLGPFTMVPFDLDTRPVSTVVSDVAVPAAAGGGTVGLAPGAELLFVNNGWSPFSSFYSGAVYCTSCVSSDTVTLTLPPGTYAFALYTMPNFYFSGNEMTVIADDGTSSPVEVWDDASEVACDSTGDCARYFGFYSTDPAAPLASITITATDNAGIGVGNFSISTEVPPTPPEPPEPPTPPTPPAPSAPSAAEPLALTPRFTG